MKDDKERKPKSFLILIIEAFGRVEETKPEPSYDPVDGKHLSTMTLDMWAKDEFPKSFLEEYIARFGDHVSQCERCQKRRVLQKQTPVEISFTSSPEQIKLFGIFIFMVLARILTRLIKYDILCSPSALAHNSLKGRKQMNIFVARQARIGFGTIHAFSITQPTQLKELSGKIIDELEKTVVEEEKSTEVVVGLCLRLNFEELKSLLRLELTPGNLEKIRVICENVMTTFLSKA